MPTIDPLLPLALGALVVLAMSGTSSWPSGPSEPPVSPGDAIIAKTLAAPMRAVDWAVPQSRPSKGGAI